MRCPACGSENFGSPRNCGNCGKPLSPPKAGPDTSAPPMYQRKTADSVAAGGETGRPLDPKDVQGRLKFDYLHSLRDSNQRCLEGLQKLLIRFLDPRMSVDSLISEAANLIAKNFAIDNVAIGLRDSDGLYRYRAMVGFRDSALQGHRQIAYKKEQFYENSHFVGSDISKLSRIYLAEENVLTEEEKSAFNRPVLLKIKRRDLSESLEGDYIDTKILGANDELLGWIEISGTRAMKLPDAGTIRWMEAIATLIAVALVLKGPR